MTSWLGDALSQGGVVVTASRRLSRELGLCHGQQQLAVGLRAWPTPEIRFINDWLDQVFESSSATATQQTRMDAKLTGVLWEQSLAGVHDPKLPGFSQLARQCSDTSSRLKDWKVSSKELKARAAGPEQQLFVAAAEHYSNLLDQHGWIDEADLTDVVAALITSRSVVLPARITLAGFDRIWPALVSLLDLLRDAGVLVTTVPPRDRATSISALSLDDRDAELRAAGAWARTVLIKDPRSRIVIISPDLKPNAVSIVRLVREGFAPGWQYAGAGHKNAVSVSYGRSLVDYPAVSTALMLLRWVVEGLSSREVSILLRSPTIGVRSLGSRCRLERRLRRVPDRSWRPTDLLEVLRDSESAIDADAWYTGIQHIVEAKKHFRGKDRPAEWARRFDELLGKTGWPGSGPLDSEEYQLINRWRDLLNELARLEPVLPALTCSDAVSRLTRLATDTVFQPESEPGVLSVIGSLEAAGMEFDKIWISGFDARRWPARGHPLAFVSRQLQRDHSMPDASPQETLQFSRRVLDRLLRSADEVVLSWAQNDNGIEQQPSALLTEIAGELQTDVCELADPGWHAAGLLGDERVHRVREDNVPPVASNEQIAGGAYTVQRQADDPFSAFANGRLRVSEFQTFQPGLSASLRGSAIHRALSLVYAEKPAQDELRTWSKADRFALFQQSAKRALAKLLWRADSSLRKIIELEQDRIEQINEQFFAAEIERENFRVAMVEEGLLYENFGVQLRLRVDRVDRLDDDSLLIIDYKSGAEKSLLNRQGELIDLQLMIYALAMPGEIGALTLINLDSRRISFKGSKRNDDWQSTFADWKKTAESAIKGIAKGDARVNTERRTDEGRALNVLSRFEELRRDR